MPKIRDLGIKVIPQTMRPPEIGGGGCSDCTYQQFSMCWPTPASARAGIAICAPSVVCSDCTFQQCSFMGGIPGGWLSHGGSCCGGFTCSDGAVQQCSFMGGITCAASCGCTLGQC